MGIIGNCSYMAHIDKNANVVWMCWPRFDSSCVFGELLDSEKCGHFYIKPATPNYESHQEYIKNTNVLKTIFDTSEGSFAVTDFAPRFYQYERLFHPLMLVRKIEVLSGSPRIIVSCNPVGDYGRLKATPYFGSNHIRYMNLDNDIRLSSNISLTYLKDRKPFVLNETKYLILTGNIPLEGALEHTAEDFLTKTVNYWQNWVKNCAIGDFHQEAVIRSSLALKIHQYHDTGAIIAAGTTSLPEAPGSERTWDYRFCWIRDAYYTLTAFNNIGHFEELERYVHFIENLAAQDFKHYQPLYSIDGETRLTETTLDLGGYLGNQPVRIGNLAYTHVQNDVYGQILLSMLPLFVDRRFSDKKWASSTKLVKQILGHIEETMFDPDAGLWEFRNKQQHHCYTYLFHWAGSCAAYKIGEVTGDKELLNKAKKLIKQATDQIEACYDPELQAYTQAIGVKSMDASLLQLITTNYLDPNSEITKNHLRKLEQELRTKEGLFYRYLHADDFGRPEVTFLVCAFWHVEALACVGRLDDAIRSFENLLKYSNSLGLLSEDVDETNGSQWGNFPQAYSHVGLMNAAFRISRKLDQPTFISNKVE